LFEEVDGNIANEDGGVYDAGQARRLDEFTEIEWKRTEL
jgi:hypothetical protein